MKVGDLVRCLIEGDFGVVTENPVSHDGWYRVLFTNGIEDFCREDELAVINEDR